MGGEKITCCPCYEQFVSVTEEERVLDTFYSFLGGPDGPTERAQTQPRSMQTGTTADGGGHQIKRGPTLVWLCAACCRRLPIVLILLRIMHGRKARFYLGMERTAANSLVPFRSVPMIQME